MSVDITMRKILIIPTTALNIPSKVKPSKTASSPPPMPLVDKVGNSCVFILTWEASNVMSCIAVAVLQMVLNITHRSPSSFQRPVSCDAALASNDTTADAQVQLIIS